MDCHLLEAKKFLKKAFEYMISLRKRKEPEVSEKKVIDLSSNKRQKIDEKKTVVEGETKESDEVKKIEQKEK